MRSSRRPALDLLLVASVACGAAGCATIISGKTQSIRVTSIPAGARVTAQPGGQILATPGTLALKRLASGYRLRFEKEGYAPLDLRLTATTNGWVWGNLILGGLVGLAIDYGNGAAYAMSPSRVEATLKALGSDGTNIQSDVLHIFDPDGQLILELSLLK